MWRGTTGVGIGYKRGQGVEGLSYVMPRLSALPWLVLVGLSVTSCRAVGRSPSAAKTTVGDSTGLQQLREAALRRLGRPSCSARSNCRVIPVGSKPCGGPWSYAVYSTATTDSAALAVAVQRYNAAEAELNRKLGRVSDCSFVAPPKLDCVDGMCAPASSPPGP